MTAPRDDATPRLPGEMRLLFIGFGDIYRSHGARVYLLSLINAMRELNCSVRAFFLQQWMGSPTGAEMADGDELASIMEAPGHDYARLFPTLLWRILELVWGNWRGLHLAWEHRRQRDVCVIVGAGLLPLARLLRVWYPTLIYVQHGIAEEFLMSGHGSHYWKYLLTKRLERTFLPAFDATIVVSAKMGEYCRLAYGVNKTIVVPCGVDLRKVRYSERDRVEMRKTLGVEHRFVFVYSGGSAEWQCLPETIRLYQLARTWIRNAFFLVLSADTGSWQRALRALDPHDYRLLSAEHADIGRYLCAGDVAFLLRKNNLVNTVSAPVKFAEYLACGLPVLTSPYVGDYSQTVRDHTVGILVDPDNESTWPPAVDALVELARDPAAKARCLSLSEALGWDTGGKRLLLALRGVCDGARQKQRQLSGDEHVSQ